MAQLIIFDANDTLAYRDTGEFLPDVEAKLFDLRGPSCAIAIATNQGGPACRDAGWSWSDEYPTLAEVEERYNALADSIGATLYMSLLFITTIGQHYLPNGIAPDDPRANPEWRKPRPGMLLQAIVDHGVAPADAVMVGDDDKDALAAVNAGIRFIHRDNYFAG